MLYLLDTANIREIRKAIDLYPIAGVTTNPTIIAREMPDFPAILGEIRSVIGPDRMLHAQVLGMTAEEMIREAQVMVEAAGDLYIKVPVVPEGIKAIRHLHALGIKTTATAVFTAQQGLLAAVAGADFVAPYVNRLDNICGDGAGVVADIVKLLHIHCLPVQVLAASFKNVDQVHRVSLAGCHAVTLSVEILTMLTDHPLTDCAVNQFASDWAKAYGRFGGRDLQ